MVSSVSVSFSIFLCAIVINNKINKRARAPSIQFLPANLNVQYNPGQIKGFALKVAISGPHLILNFMNVMQ